LAHPGNARINQAGGDPKPDQATAGMGDVSGFVKRLCMEHKFDPALCE
jgi:hypothetical protein